MPGMLPSHGGRRDVYTPFPWTERPPLNDLLMFAERHLPELRPPARHVRERFGCSEAVFQMWLNESVNDPAARAISPDVIEAVEFRLARFAARRHLALAIDAERSS